MREKEDADRDTLVITPQPPRESVIFKFLVLLCCFQILLSYFSEKMSVPPAPKKSRRNEVSYTSAISAHFLIFQSNMIEEDSVICDDDNDDSSCTMYFVKLPDGKPTEQEDENFLDAYNVRETSLKRINIYFDVFR